MSEVSVVIPSYNSARYLPAAVESVLGQTVRDLEVLVIDDGSTDATEAVMGRYGPPVRYVRQTNQGVAVARNRGIAEGRGRYVAFLDADDTWLPYKLERQLAALRLRPDCRACYSGYTVVDANLRPLGVRPCWKPELSLEDLLLHGNRVGSICTVLCERSLLEQAGGFDPAFSQCADWDLWVRLAQWTRFLAVDESLATYRQHECNMSRNARLLEDDSLRVLEKGFRMTGLPPGLQARRWAALGRNYRVLAGTYLQARRSRDCARCLVRALALDPRQFPYMMAWPWRIAVRRLTEVY